MSEVDKVLLSSVSLTHCSIQGHMSCRHTEFICTEYDQGQEMGGWNAQRLGLFYSYIQSSLHLLNQKRNVAYILIGLDDMTSKLQL